MKEKDRQTIFIFILSKKFSYFQVRSGLTHDKFGDLNVDSTAASSVWIPTDHRYIVISRNMPGTIILLKVYRSFLFTVLPETTVQLYVNLNMGFPGIFH